MKSLLTLILTTLRCHAGRTAENAGHPFACTDYTQGKVFIVSAEGTIE